MHAFVSKQARRSGSTWRVGVVFAMAAVLGACSLSPWRSDGISRTGANGGTDSLTDDYPRSSVVALDFVDAMVELDEIDPAVTTFFTDRPTSRFGEIFVSALQSAGYDLRLGRSDDGMRLDYTVSSQAAESDTEANRYIFQVNAGMLRLKRSYEVDVAGVRPTGEMLLHGSAGASRMSQTARSRVVTPASAAVSSSATAAVTLTKLPEPVAARRDAASKRNLYVSGLSNYADILASYDTLRRDIMVFPNDSLYMGSDNKQLAQRIVDGFDANRDVISLIGCSHGSTALDNGNEILANGRSLRVKEEFTLAGIDAELVLDEGCWASRHFDRMPARGVVVTHKRRTRS